MATINEVLGEYPDEARGYLVALPADHGFPLSRVRWYMSHDVYHGTAGHSHDRITTSGYNSIGAAHLFATYQEAWEIAQHCARHWAGGRFADQIRIVEVTRRPPLIVHNSHPINVLDALAEVKA